MAQVEEEKVVLSEEEEQEEEEEVKVVEDCSNSDVVTKYKLAAEIVNLALAGVIAQCQIGKSVADICKFGDALIRQRCAAVFKAKKVDKGVAFPTCVSVNETVCHNSPLASESTLLKEGDWLKIDLGCQIDGYIAVAAHTHVVTTSEEEEQKKQETVLTGPAADVLQCAKDAVNLCARLIKPGNKNVQVTEALEKVAESYGVQAIQGTLMHQMKRFVIDGNKMITQKHDKENRLETITFEANEVYTIDVCFTTGKSGKPIESEQRTTVFKRQVEKNYRLKMKASRYVFSEINKHFPTLPFSISSFEDERQARMGVVECVKHDLLQPYPILHVKPGDLVAHFKVTILLLPSGTTIITGVEPTIPFKSDKHINDQELVDLLATSLKNKKKNRKKKKASTTTTQEE